MCIDNYSITIFKRINNNEIRPIFGFSLFGRTKEELYEKAMDRVSDWVVKNISEKERKYITCKIEAI